MNNLVKGLIFGTASAIIGFVVGVTTAEVNDRKESKSSKEATA